MMPSKKLSCRIMDARSFSLCKLETADLFLIGREVLVGHLKEMEEHKRKSTQRKEGGESVPG
jgi:hypothetical protein